MQSDCCCCPCSKLKLPLCEKKQPQREEDDYSPTKANSEKMISLLLLLVLSLMFSPAEASDCSDMLDCASCVSKTSWWNGNACRWCPQDNGCHAFGAFATNKCSITQNVVKREDCANTPPVYQPTLADKMLKLSSVSYAYNIPHEKCLSHLLPESNVQVVQTFASSCGVLFSNECAGFVGLSHTERAITIAFRGSSDGTQIADQLLAAVTFKEDFPGSNSMAAVQLPFYDAFDSLWPKMEDLVKDLCSRYPEYSVWVTGHSLGGAIASMASTWIVHRGIASRARVVSYTFGMPRVGNYEYAVEHDSLVNNSFRVVNANDVVPHLPGWILDTPIKGPYHHGIEVYYSLPEGARDPKQNFKVCTGFPNNEDWACGYSSPLPSIDRHQWYFGLKVGDRCSHLADYLAAVPHADQDLGRVRIVEDEETDAVLAYDVKSAATPDVDVKPALIGAGVLLAAIHHLLI